MSDQTRPLTEFDRQCIQAFQMWESLGRPEDPNTAAQALDIPRHTFSNRLLKYFLRDLGSRLPFEMQTGMELKNHAVTLDADGNVKSETYRTGLESRNEGFEMPDGYRMARGTFQVRNGVVEREWIKIAEGERTEEEINEAARLAAERYAGPAAPLATRQPSLDGANPYFQNHYLLPDLHIGSHVNSYVGQKDWNLETAISTYKQAIRENFETAPGAKSCLILGGGDLLHYDDPTKMTRASGNVLDGAEPYEVVLSGAEDLLVFMVELALMKHVFVRVRILKGNHDPDSAIAVAHYLAAWFRNEPRVTVVLDGKIYHVEEWGRCMIGYTHGHALRIDRLPGVMAADHRKMWGRVEHVHAHGFHVHHKMKSAGVADSVPWETHEAPTPRDDYHEDAGYRGPQRLPVITYHKETGEKHRTQVTL